MKHAHAVCWNKIPDLQNEHGWICNEAVYKALTYAKSFKGNSKFSTWFHRIVVNICNNVLKAKQKKGEEVEITDAIEDSLGNRSGVDGEIWVEEIAQLGSQRDRQIVRLLGQGWTQEEVAEKVGMKPGALRQEWMRLKRRLRNAGSE